MKPCAVIFDRDGTIVHDVPYNGDPAAVRIVEGVKEKLDALRAAGLPLAVVSNQSGVARGIISEDQVRAVNARVEELLGPFAVMLYCPHSPDDRCDCRKPKPKLILDAARTMDVDAACCVVIGDKESDVQAAENAGARPIAIGRASEVLSAIDAVLEQL